MLPPLPIGVRVLSRSSHNNASLVVLFLFLLIIRDVTTCSAFAAQRRRTRTNHRENNAFSSSSSRNNNNNNNKQNDDPKGFGTKNNSDDNNNSNDRRANKNARAAITTHSSQRRRQQQQQQGERGFSTNKKTTAAAAATSSSSSSSSSSYIPDTSETTLQFMDFLKENNECEGIEALEIGFDTQTGLRGIFYCRHRNDQSIRAGEYICAIPFVSTLLVNEQVCDEKATTATATPSSSTPPPSDILSASRLENGLYFLQRFWKDQEQYQRWKPYFDCLPRDRNDPNFDPTPDFWSPEEICELQIPSLVDSILARKQGLEALFLSLTAANNNDNDNDDAVTMTLEELQHAAWLIQTRAFTTFQKVPVHNNPFNNNDDSNNNEYSLRSRTVLIPYLDFINHSDGKTNAELQVVESKEYDESFYALRATRNIQAGKEIRICYGTGQETFLDLYAKYGFLLPPTTKKDRQRLLKHYGLVDTSCFTTTLEEDEQEFAITPRESTRARILEVRICVKRLLEKKTKRRKEPKSTSR